MVDARWLDRGAAGIFCLVSMALLLAWPAWRLSDEMTIAGTATDTQAFIARAEAYAAAHAVGQRDGMPLVRPPPGGEVPVLVRRFEFWPALELTAGQSVRLRLAALDSVHSAAIAGQEVLLVPGETRVIEITPAQPGTLALQCAEYCGLGHNRMGAQITVLPGR